MTDLKKNIPLFIYDKHPNPPPRLKELLVELEKVEDSNPKPGDVCPFTRPVLLGGQTYSNQSGFGSRYEGYECVSEGTLYGETTGFFIIGVILHRW